MDTPVFATVNQEKVAALMKHWNWESVMLGRGLTALDFYHALFQQQQMEEGQAWVGPVCHWITVIVNQNQILVA